MEEFNIGPLKEFTGGDTIYARDLYGNGEYVVAAPVFEFNDDEVPDLEPDFDDEIPYQWIRTPDM